MRKNAQGREVIGRTVTTNRGSTWLPNLSDLFNPSFNTRAYDPSLAAKPDGGPFLYTYLQFGEGSGGSPTAWYNTSPNGETLNLAADDDAAEVVPDREWALYGVHPYLSWVNSISPTQIRLIKGEPGSGGAIVWPTSSAMALEAVAGTNLVPHPAIARGLADATKTMVFAMGLQFKAGEPKSDDNEVRVVRSTNGGGMWGLFPVNVLFEYKDSYDGFVADRDRKMAQFHIVGDHGTSEARKSSVYAFYVRNEMGPLIVPQDVLYCKVSNDNGATWSGEKPVFPQSFVTPPSHGYAPVPPNDSGNPNGFLRIGRVWSCVDGQGRVHVVWFDNRAGKYVLAEGDPPEYEGRDLWRVYRSMSTDGGNTWSAAAAVADGLSLGGFGQPPDSIKHAPPGDFISCDADWDRLYVAWCDSRDFRNSNPDLRSRVYVRTITP